MVSNAEKISIQVERPQPLPLKEILKKKLMILYFRQTVEDTGLSYHVVCNIITVELDMKKLCARWVSRMLTDAHKQTGVDICSCLLRRYRQKCLQDVTMDESWIYHYDVETKTQYRVDILTHYH